MENPGLTINIANAPWKVCECGSHLFKQVLMFKKISQFESPSGSEESVPLDLVICEECGKIPSFVSSKIKGEPIPVNLLASKPLIKLDGE